MEVNKLEGKEVMIIGFGGVTLLTIVVLSSIYVGHAITVTSNVPTAVHVSAAAPKVEVNVPQGPAPRVEVTSAAPNVNVQMPASLPPTVNVSTPPATVTVLDKREHSDSKAISEHTDNKPTVVPVSTPATVPASYQTTAPAPAAPLAPLVTPAANKSGEAKGDLDSVYGYAERYIESYCKKNNLDANLEAKKWLTKWNSQVETAVRDGISTDEQAYINRVVVDKRDCFDLEKASPDKIVEGCRLMLRYRDAKLTWIQAMKDAATSENIQKTLAFLAAGAK